MKVSKSVFRLGLGLVTASALVLGTVPAHAVTPSQPLSYFTSFDSGQPTVYNTFDNYAASVDGVSGILTDHPGNVYSFSQGLTCNGQFKLRQTGTVFTSVSHPTIKMDVYSPAAGTLLRIKIEKSGVGNSFIDLTLGAGWNLDVTADFSGVTGWDPSIGYDTIVVFPGYQCGQYGHGGAGLDTYLIDNIQANGGDKPTPTIASAPTASDITYGQTLADSTLSGGTASVDGSFAFTTPSTAPNAGAANQAVTFTPTDSHNYRDATTSTSVQVNKATPTILTNPTASDLTLCDKWAFRDSALTGGLASVPGSFAWDNSNGTSGAGTFAQDVTFTPTDSLNYATVALKVDLTMNKGTPHLSQGTLVSATDLTYGQKLADSTLDANGYASHWCGIANIPGTYTFDDPNFVPNAGTADQNVTWTPNDSANFNAVTHKVSVKVNKANVTWSVDPTVGALQYGNSLATLNLNTSNTFPSVPGTFAFSDPTVKPNVGLSNELVTFTPADADNYNSHEFSIQVETVGPWINSVNRQGLWNYVDFTLPALSNGKRYDRVAYRINGGAWVNWGVFSKSAQKLTGIKAKRNYTVQIRAHVNKGAWTGVSNVVPFYSGK